VLFNLREENYSTTQNLKDLWINFHHKLYL